MSIARKLIEAEQVPFGYRRGDNAAFSAAGGVPCGSVTELIERSKFVLLCLPARGLHELFLAHDSVSARARPGQVFIDLGVAPLALKLRLRERLADAQAFLLDAPMMGNPALIEAGRAVVYVSGDATAAAAAEAVLLNFAARVPYVGDFGNGSKLKYVSNLLLAVHTVAAAEAIKYGRRAGLDMACLLGLMSPIVQSGVLAIRGKDMANGIYGTGGGTVALLLDVIGIIEEDARLIDARVPLLHSAKRVFEDAARQGYGNMDVECMASISAEESQHRVGT